MGSLEGMEGEGGGMEGETGRWSICEKKVGVPKLGSDTKLMRDGHEIMGSRNKGPLEG